MKLKKIFPEKNIPGGIDITGITDNSKEVKPGYLFIAVPGKSSDGHFFIEDALKRGAGAVICNRKTGHIGRGNIIEVESTREIVWLLGKRYYRDPSTRLKITGVTGTNGKTTVSYLIKNILEAAGIHTGLLGTIDYIIGTRRIPAVLTTPGTLQLNRFMAQMVAAGCQACVMEVSSHALEQGRTRGIAFETAVFTNLGRDHLDYHKTKDKYLEAKGSLFQGLPADGIAVINMDDSCAASIRGKTRAGVIGYGIGENAGGDILRPKEVEIKGSGMTFIVFGQGKEIPISTNLLGYHNVYNILAAVGVALGYKIPQEAIEKGIAGTGNIPGRLERISRGQPFEVFIDYAHTAEALENVLFTLRGITKGKIILVFGCGGNRDREKRHLMGKVADKMADFAIITTDNPRQEAPEKIAEDIRKGFVNDRYKVIINRKDAVAEAIFTASRGDIIVIAGKGHENYQIMKNSVVPFNDRDAVEECLNAFMAGYVS